MVSLKRHFLPKIGRATKICLQIRVEHKISLLFPVLNNRIDRCGKKLYSQTSEKNSRNPSFSGFRRLHHEIWRFHALLVAKNVHINGQKHQKTYQRISRTHAHTTAHVSQFFRSGYEQKHAAASNRRCGAVGKGVRCCWFDSCCAMSFIFFYAFAGLLCVILQFSAWSTCSCILRVTATGRCACEQQ